MSALDADRDLAELLRLVRQLSTSGGIQTVFIPRSVYDGLAYYDPMILYAIDEAS